MGRRETTNITGRREISVKSWGLQAGSKEDISKIQRIVDTIFSGYSFYPEHDWKNYRFPPPEGHEVLGAWRHPETRAFGFLLDNPRITAVGTAIQLLLYMAGEVVEIARLEKKIHSVKNNLAIHARKATADLTDGERLKRVDKKSFAVFTSALVLFSAIVNGFSLYIRKLPPPTFDSALLSNVYTTLVGLVHFAALVLLFVLIVICVAFLTKYGVLFIRRL